MDLEKQTRFIPGVYAHCDRWCERCRFQARCRLFYDSRRHEDAVARGAPDDEGWELMKDEDAEEEAGRPMTASEKLDWETFLAEANRPLSAEEQAAHERRERRIHALVD